MFDVTDVPIGDLTAASSLKTPDLKAKGAIEVDIPSEEKETFDVWLRKLWYEKDESINKFFETKTFEFKPGQTPAIDIPVELRKKREILDAFCFFWPAGIAYLWGKIRG